MPLTAALRLEGSRARPIAKATAETAVGPARHSAESRRSYSMESHFIK